MPKVCLVNIVINTEAVEISLFCFNIYNSVLGHFHNIVMAWNPEKKLLKIGFVRG